MKIIRYQESSGNINYAAETSDGVFRIEGDLFGDYSVTEEAADVAKRPG